MRYFLHLSYNGTSYHGWQRQENVLGIQQVLEEALAKPLRQPTPVMASGRTDAGVHACQQVVHFNTAQPLAAQHLLYTLNRLLPPDIRVHHLQPVVPAAHARYHAHTRTYKYYLHQAPNPFIAHTSYHHPQPIDGAAIRTALPYLLGEHNFQCFSLTKTNVKTFTCTIKHVQWLQVGRRTIFSISANRFLRGMVRALVGTLLAIGKHQHAPDYLQHIIAQKKRPLAGPSVPARGLFLTRVDYPPHLYLHPGPYAG